MNEMQLYAMQEAEGFGAWLIEAIATPLGIPIGKNTAELISNHIYNGTSNVTVTFDVKGILVTAIVEGDGSEFYERVNVLGLMDRDDADAELNKRFWAAVVSCDEQANSRYEAYFAENSLPPLPRHCYAHTSELTTNQRRWLRRVWRG